MNDDRRGGFLQSVVLIILVLAGIWAYGEWKNGRLQLPDGNDPLPVLMTPQAGEATPVVTELYPISESQPADPNAELNAAAKEAELKFVTAALENSQRVASACLDAWVSASMTGKELPNCQPILQQVQDLSVRKLNLEQ